MDGRKSKLKVISAYLFHTTHGLPLILYGGLLHIPCKESFFISSSGPETTESGMQHTHRYYWVWKADGPKCNCFNGRKGEGSLKDWLRDLVSRWTNQRGSQGHSQGPRQTNIPVISLSHPWTRALLHSRTLKETKTHLESSRASYRVFSRGRLFIHRQSCALPQGWNRLQTIWTIMHHLLAFDWPIRHINLSRTWYLIPLWMPIRNNLNLMHK